MAYIITCCSGVFYSIGDSVFKENGEVDRIKLGQLVFNDVEKRKLLNYITHPEIHRTIYKQIVKHFLLGASFVVMDLPLLFETGILLPYIHKIITVTWLVSQFVSYFSTFCMTVFARHVIK